MEGGGIRTQDYQDESDTVTALALAIHYLANSDACLRVQFKREGACRAGVSCEECWREELERGEG